MTGKFSISPTRCSAQTEELGQVSAGLTEHIGRLEHAKDQLGKIQGNSYGYIAAALEQLIVQVQQEKSGVAAMKGVLSDSILCYENTDRLIGERKIPKGNTESIGMDQFLADVLMNISGWRSNAWEIMMESFLLKGFLGENILDDLKQIWGGTYVTSQWKNGMQYLKLHQNGMTNQEIARWLEEHVGGNWDDYSARRMKDFNFAIYNCADHRFADGMKYFREVSDGQLQSYFSHLRELGSLENPSLGAVFLSEFKPLDDFNYKGFREVSKLGKAGKVLGTLGTVLTIGGDVTDNLYNADTGTWSFSGNKVADCAWDVGVDLAVGAGSAAAGAAVGSLIVPPVGTVVGAGVGIAVDFIANNVKLWDMDGDGENDSLVDSIKKGGDVLVDAVEDIGGNVCDWLGNVFAF